MRNVIAGVFISSLLAGFISSACQAQDATVERTREMLRRTQEALRQAQTDNAELTRAKSAAEEKALAAAKQTDAAVSGSKTAQQSLRAQLSAAQSVQADLSQKLAAANAQLAGLGDKQRETAQLLANRDAELTQTKQLLELSKATNLRCEDKNGKLYTYGQEVLERYKNKGVFTALSQKEPVFGFKDVAIENVVQEYKIKMAAEKIKPATP
jgi:chromosome segregation ATPase